MKEEKTTISNINSLEENTLRYSKQYLSDILEFIEYLQETLLIAFHNSGEPLPINDIPNNPKLFAYITTTRAFSISKIALDITIRGYPLEGMALARTLAELVKCTEYLLVNTEFIGKFIHGALKVNKILNLAKKESEHKGEYLFGRLWGVRSKFSHSTPELIFLPLESSGQKRVTAELVMNDMSLNRSVAIDLLSQLLLQYFFFRTTFLGELNVTDELETRDKKIFDSSKINQFTTLEPAQIKQINDVLNHLTQGGNESN